MMSDWLTVSFGSMQGSKSVTIFHISGKEKVHQEVEKQDARFLVSDYAQGHYILQVKTGKVLKCVRFVKE